MSRAHESESRPECVRNATPSLGVTLELLIDDDWWQWYEDQILMRSRMVNAYDPHEGSWERRGLGGEDASSDDDSVSSESSEVSDEET